MEILFLYNRLYGLCQKQLEAIRDKEFDLVDSLTSEREDLTGKIFRMIESNEADISNPFMNRKAREITDLIIFLDEDIKESLLDELYHRTMELSRLELHDE